MTSQNSADPTGVVGTGKEATRARQRKSNAAIAMRLGGASWNEIAYTLGYPTARAALVSCERALEKEIKTGNREDLRRLAGARLERLLRAVWPKAIDPDHPEQMTAVSRAKDLIGQHAKLFGLDAPTEVVVHNPTAAEIEAWVARITAATTPTVVEYDIIGDTHQIETG